MRSAAWEGLSRLVSAATPRGAGLAVVQLFSARMAGQVAGFLAAILVARALGPSGFGSYSLALTIALILATVPGGGLDLAVVRVSARHWAGQPGRARDVLLAGGVIRAGAALLLTLAGLAAAWTLNDPLALPALALPVACAALAGFAIAMGDYILAALQARERFGRMFALNLAGAALKLLPVVALAALGALTLPLALLAFLLAVFLAAGVGVLLTRNGWGGPARWDRAAAGELLHCSRWLMLTATLGVLTAGVDVVALTHVAGTEIAGIYTSARTLSLPMTIAGGTVGAVLLPRLTRLVARVDLYREARAVGLRVAALAALAAAALMGVAPMAVLLVFGGAYADTVAVFQLLVAACAVEIATWPALVVLLALDRAELTAGLSLVVLLVTLGGVMLAAPGFGAAGAATVVLISRVIVGLLYLAFVWGARPARATADGSRHPVTL